MAKFGSKDLLYTYPAGNTPGDDPKLRGEPDSSLFSRHEKHEVLYLLNKLAEKYSDVDAAKYERLIHQHLPSTTRSQQNVYNWIVANWNNYA